MKIRDVGEFRLIELLAEIVGRAGSGDVVVGIGDDAAVWRGDSSLQLGTTDAMIGGVHFSLENATWAELGWKALAMNISDIAAMGGRPAYALVSLALPGETEVDQVTDLYRGLMESAEEFGVSVVGGNVSSSPVIVISVSLIGSAPYGVLSRSAALPGDLIAVTGYLGQSAAGLAMLSTGMAVDRDAEAYLRGAHLRPYPRVAEGQALVRNGVKAAIDLSDGLVGDMGHVAKASGVSATLRADRLPIHPVVREGFGEKARMLALSGGEDYELLFAAGGDIIDRVRGDVTGPVTVVGEVSGGEAGRVTIVDEDGTVVEPAGKSWEHFRG